eukprot:19598_4
MDASSSKTHEQLPCVQLLAGFHRSSQISIPEKQQDHLHPGPLQCVSVHPRPFFEYHDRSASSERKGRPASGAHIPS